MALKRDVSPWYAAEICLRRARNAGNDIYIHVWYSASANGERHARGRYEGCLAAYGAMMR